MKKHFSKITILIFFAIASLVLVCSSFLFLYRDIIKTKTNNEALVSSLDADTKKNIELDAIQKNINLTISNNQSLESFFIAKDKEVDFITLVESIAKKSGLKVSTKNIESKTSDELSKIGKGLLAISIETDGSWDATQEFLKLLSNLPYKISINSIDLSFGEFTDSNDQGKSASTGAKLWKVKIDFDVVRNLN